MASPIPSVEQVRARLLALPQAKIKTIAEYSGVPFGTLMNIRQGGTKNPGLETVRAFFPLLPELPQEGRETTGAQA